MQHIAKRIELEAESSRLFRNRASAFSYAGGEPRFFTSTRSIFSHSQLQATSYVESHTLGSNERNAASIQFLYSERFTAPLVWVLEIFSARTSHSSCNRAEFDAFVTKMSKQRSTSLSQPLVFSPITDAFHSKFQHRMSEQPFPRVHSCPSWRTSPHSVTRPDAHR